MNPNSFAAVYGTIPQWISGIAAVIALSIAVWSQVSANRRAIRDRVRNETERLTRSRALAVSITPDLIYVEVSVRRAAAVVHERLANPIVIDQIMKQPDAIKRVSGLMRLAKIELPTMLERFSTELWRLDGEASATTSQLVAILHQWNQMLDRWLTGMEAPYAVYLANDAKLLTGHVQALLLVSSDAIAQVKKLHDRPTLKNVDV